MCDACDSIFGEGLGICLREACFSIMHYLRIRLERYNYISFKCASGIKFDKCYEDLGSVPSSRCRLTRMGIPIIKLKLSYERQYYLYHVDDHTWKDFFILRRGPVVLQVQRRWRTVRFCEFLESSRLTSSAKEHGWAMIQITIINFGCYKQVKFLRELWIGPVSQRGRNTCYILRDWGANQDY